MSQPTVKTVQIVDPRIEPQPDPVYDYVIAPTQNQFYRIPASGKSNSSITFNNLTTLGIDRAYEDTFEIELTAEFTFEREGDGDSTRPVPAPDEWTFDSFPFNKCCEEIHVNINGGAFFSQPLSYLRAKERYMDQAALSRCYENVCPVQKPHLQYESGNDYTSAISAGERRQQFNETKFATKQLATGAAGDASVTLLGSAAPASAIPTRYGYGMKNWQQGTDGMAGGFNNSIVRLGAKLNNNVGYENYSNTDANGVVTPKKTRVVVTWREPIFCSPFSSRYDATYGRPLYNITSMDITFTMQDLGNMIRLMNTCDNCVDGEVVGANNCIKNYTVNILSANLCYQVMTIPPVLTKPLTTLVPYRRFVPYITDNATTFNGSEVQKAHFKSGVYTFNEVPTAIWLFVQPSKRNLQTNVSDVYAPAGDPVNNALRFGNWDSNRLFAYIDHVNLTLANTTQILDTAQPRDLYRIAKANGCEDSFLSWNGHNVLRPCGTGSVFAGWTGANPDGLGTGENKTLYTSFKTMYDGAGSVLRLVPGVDIIIPDQALIPGANANNMVFQAEVDAYIPKHSAVTTQYSLWLLFEYVGVAAISPGQCEITMNPLGSGEIMASSPVVSATSEATEGKLEGGGNGMWDRIIKALKIANQIAKDTGIISRILKLIPGDRGKQVASFLEKAGVGTSSDAMDDGGMAGSGRASKRSRGGAVMGRGLQDWSI